MYKNLLILAALVLVVALPFVFKQEPPSGNWKPGDPELVIISPHTEAIRYEFERAFSVWHEKKYGKPVKISWRNIGGTSEIARYLDSEFVNATRAWAADWASQNGKTITRDDLTKMIASSKPDGDAGALWQAFRDTDDPEKFSTKIDIFFGGGWFDHNAQRNKGQVVKPWTPGSEPDDVKASLARIPKSVSREFWRDDFIYGTAVSTFGIVYNTDRLKQLNIPEDQWPRRWEDLKDPRYFKQIGAADPTKSGSIAKTFEMIIHEQMYKSASRYLQMMGVEAGQVDATIARLESAIDAIRKAKGRDYKLGEVPEGSDGAVSFAGYQQSLEDGWVDGINLCRAIGANARYFTDSGSKVPIDVSMGDAAVGMAIDFYGRYQAQATRAPDGTERMRFITPLGGTSVSCDPITLLRGAGGNGRNPQEMRELRQIAIHFIEFVLSEEGQRLWTYEVGSEGGPEKYALRRLPIRDDFYPSTQPNLQQSHERHRKFATDDLADPTIDPFAIARHFTYYDRWTGGHFSVQRDLIRAMCMDSGEELRAAWSAIRELDPKSEQYKRAMALLNFLPAVELTTKDGKKKVEPLTWRNAINIRRNYELSEYTRLWVAAFRLSYDQAHRAAVGFQGSNTTPTTSN
jgi:iron(III) transport system substrate-binding protein